MKDWINSVLRNIAFYWYVIPVMGREVTGRIYIWRDVPNWVLDEIIIIDAMRPDPEHDMMENFYSQAREEWALRARNLLLQLERATDQS